MMIVKSYFIHNCSTDGQSIAIRLSRRINVVTKQLKSKLAIINAARCPTRRITWEQVTQLDGTDFPVSLRHNAVRLYHTIARADEEEYTVLKEMRNTAKYYLDKLKELNEQLHAIDMAVSHFNKGKHSLLTWRRQVTINHLVKLETFLPHGDFPALSQFLQDSQSKEEDHNAEEDVSRRQSRG